MNASKKWISEQVNEVNEVNKSQDPFSLCTMTAKRTPLGVYIRSAMTMINSGEGVIVNIVSERAEYLKSMRHKNTRQP